MPEKEAEKTGSSTVSKRSFLKQAGAAAVALTTVGASQVGADDVSPEKYCVTETELDNERAGAGVCVSRFNLSSLDEVTVRFRLDDTNYDGAVGDFYVANKDTCDRSEMTKHDVYSDTVTIEETYSNPNDAISVLVEGSMTCTIETEQCTY